jgi:hypothetical protein
MGLCGRAASSSATIAMNRPTPLEARVRACVRLMLALLDLGGIGVALPAAMQVVGRRQVLTLGPQLQTPLGLSALFLHRHMVQNGPIIWYHCHGMEQFGLPDLESRGPLVEVETARQLVEQGVLYLLANGTALHPGLTLEAFDGDSAGMIRVAQARAVSGHSYGAYGALELTLTAR